MTFNQDFVLPERNESSQLEHCPSCFEPKKPEDVKCAYCSLYIPSFLVKQREAYIKSFVKGLEHLRKEEIEPLLLLWSKIRAVPADASLHEAFLSQSIKKRALPLCLFLYGEQEGPIFSFYKTQVLALLSAQEEMRETKEENPLVPSLHYSKLYFSMGFVSFFLGLSLLMQSFFSVESYWLVSLFFILVGGSVMGFVRAID